MGDIVQFPSADQRRLRDEAVRLDRARREWTMLSGYDRDAAAAAMTEFYRIWFMAAERQGHFEERDHFEDDEEAENEFGS